MTAELDRAWVAIDALRIDRDCEGNDPFDRGHDCAINHSLQIIERLGGNPHHDSGSNPPRYVPGSQDPHPRPGYHVQAGRHGPGGSPPATRGHDRLLPCATLDALNVAGPDRAGWADAFNTHEADSDDTPPDAA